MKRVAEKEQEDKIKITEIKEDKVEEGKKEIISTKVSNKTVKMR